MKTTFLITCEHASREFPPGIAAPDPGAFPEHRFWDPGARAIANHLANHLPAPCLVGHWSRLFIDLNRSEKHPRVTSLKATPETKSRWLREHHTPFRQTARAHIQKALEGGNTQLIHLSIHTFTPIFDGKPRRTHLGLLYDPGRPAETHLARPWLQALRQTLPHLTIHANQPYRGISDGHVTQLRHNFPANHYLGFELEYASDQATTQGETLAHATHSTLQTLIDQPVGLR